MQRNTLFACEYLLASRRRQLCFVLVIRCPAFARFGFAAGTSCAVTIWGSHRPFLGGILIRCRSG